MAIVFKHRYKSDSLIGSGTYKFRPYTITSPLPKLSTPQNVSADGTTVSWDEVENATSYAVLADGSEIGTVEVVAEDELAGTWVFNENVFGKNIYNNITFNVTFVSNGQTFNSIIFDNNPMNGGMFYDTLQVVHPDDASHFIDQSYRTITITSKLSEVENGDTLLALLQANATKQ